MAMRFNFNESTLGRGIDRMAERAGAVILLYAKTKAPVIEAEMKGTRPWTDQTGAAKASLRVSVSNPEPNIVRMTLAHGVHYGIWLELANEKNFAIIEPTLRYSAPEVIEELQGIMGEMT
jgi:hypothetical protein